MLRSQNKNVDHQANNGVHLIEGMLEIKEGEGGGAFF
jgi:hypothetical protein